MTGIQNDMTEFKGKQRGLFQTLQQDLEVCDRGVQLLEQRLNSKAWEDDGASASQSSPASAPSATQNLRANTVVSVFSHC
jgi:hypothetical protein